MKARILLADDHAMMREGLRALLETRLDMEVVAEAEDGEATVRLAQELLPDVVIMDIGMPNMNGIIATQKIIAEVPGAKVVALSMHSDKRFVTKMFKAGASGYLLKDCVFRELADAIGAVMSNQKYLSPRIATIVVDEYVSRVSTEESASGSVLTAREREVLQLLAGGKTTEQAAGHLQLSVPTVQKHRQNIMKKLGIHKSTELVKYAIREGLTLVDN